MASNLQKIVVLCAISLGAFVGIFVFRTYIAPREPSDAGLANPASVFCEEQGGTIEIINEAEGQVGYCHLPNGRVCEKWALYRSMVCVPPGNAGDESLELNPDNSSTKWGAGGGQSIILANSQSDDVVDGRSTQMGTFIGYHNAYEQDAWRSKVTCHALIVLEGHHGLTQYFTDMIHRGNTVQSLIDGHLLLNLPWEEIPEADQQRIVNSSAEAPVSITLQKEVQEGRDAPTCHSFFSYVGLE